MELNDEYFVTREREKADKMLKDADTMLQMEYWDMAANRYYYACYHLVTALLIKNGVHTKTHEGLIRQFCMAFVKTGLIESVHGAFLSRLEQLRKRADYNAAYDIEKEDVLEMKSPVHEFFIAVKKLFEDKE